MVFKILTYLYACFQRKDSFTEVKFLKIIGYEVLSEEYLHDIIYTMQEDGLIKGANFVKAWGKNKILISPYSELEITSSGINYLIDNSKMNSIKEIALTVPGLLCDLIKLIGF